MATNRVVRLVSRPVGDVTRENFTFTDEPIPEPGEGEFRVRVDYISLDPANRGWMNENPVYVPAIPLGGVMMAGGAGIVEKSNHPKFKEGQAVTGMFGVQRYALSNGRAVVPVDPKLAPLPRWIGGLGMPGATAYLGMTRILEPKEGQVLVCSGASGAVGSIVGQMARKMGCRTIGIAGGPDKCERAKAEYGYDEMIDYKSDKVSSKLRQYAPDGIDMYFENVGGDIGNAVLHRLRPFARVALCGFISRYNATDPNAGGYDARAISSLLVNRVKLQGFIVLDYGKDAYQEAVTTLATWHAKGELNVSEDVREGGVDAYVETLNLLFTGGNQAKLVLKL